MEKPVAVDVPGVQAVMKTAERASSLGLSVMTGTQLRRELPRMEVYKRVRDGAIGDIRSVRAIRNQGALWYRVPQPGWSDMEYMIRDWVNWAWLSGDIIVEQHIHHLDAMLWILGKTPVSAVGMGARVRRKTGDQYDFFSIDYTFDDGVHMHSTIRQLNGCANGRDESIVGTQGHRQPRRRDLRPVGKAGLEVRRPDEQLARAGARRLGDGDSHGQADQHRQGDRALHADGDHGPRLGLHRQRHHVDRPDGLDAKARPDAVRARPGGDTAAGARRRHRPRAAAQPDKS